MLGFEVIIKRKRTSENSLSSEQVHIMIERIVRSNLETLNHHLKNSNEKFDVIVQELHELRQELHELRQKTNKKRSEALTNQRTKKGVKK